VARRAELTAAEAPAPFHPIEETSMTPSLYERLGQAAGIRAIVEDAVDRHAANPLLAPRFDGRDLARAKEMGTTFFCMGAGGPQTYAGRDLRTAHAGMNISEQELVATIDDFVAAMQGHGVGPAEVNEVVGILFSLKGEVMRT
jgi:hemoglobin